MLYTILIIVKPFSRISIFIIFFSILNQRLFFIFREIFISFKPILSLLLFFSLGKTLKFFTLEEISYTFTNVLTKNFLPENAALLM